MPSQHHSASKIFAKPEDILASYLLEDELVLYDDAPSLYAFLINQLPLLVFIGIGAFASVVWAVEDNHPVVTGLILIALGMLLTYLLLQRATQLYTRYVLTNFRVMRMSGVLRRSNAWIPWVKVTDVRYEASFMGRLLGFATLSIDSANELSGLKELKNLRDPARCELAMVEAVRAKQSGKQIGPAAPALAASNPTSPLVEPLPRGTITELSDRLAELLSAGPVTVTISYPAAEHTSPTDRHAVIVLDETGDVDDDGDDFDATRFD